MILSLVVFTMEMPPMEVPLTNILAPLLLKHQTRHTQALEHCSSCPPPSLRYYLDRTATVHRILRRR